MSRDAWIVIACVTAAAAWMLPSVILAATYAHYRRGAPKPGVDVVEAYRRGYLDGASARHGPEPDADALVELATHLLDKADHLNAAR